MSWPANQFAANVPRQRADRARFLDRLFANRRPAGLVPLYATGGEREYGSTEPFQRFTTASRVNRPDTLQASSRFVSFPRNTNRPRR